MSNYITKNATSPSEATAEGLDAGAGSIVISYSNGAMEVRHGADGTILMQVKNVRKGTMTEIWRILSNCGETEFRAGGK